jgi:hypothetical protein
VALDRAGEGGGSGRVRAGKSGWGLGMRGGVHLSARGKKKGAYRFEKRPGRPWDGSGAGSDSVPRPFSFFFLLFFFCFYFLICFITFSCEHQIDSNQFLKFSNIQHNILKTVRSHFS